jgi:chemotaxis signal transduction protein
MKISHSRSNRKAPTSGQERAILFSVGGTTFAIAADAVDEIRNLDGLEPCAPASLYQRLAKVRFTLERQRCCYFVVDAGAHFGMPTAASQAMRLMVMRNVRSAVLVGTIERMHDIGVVLALPGAFQGEERRWYRGLTVLKGRVIPVLKPDAFLTRADLTLLEASCAPARKIRGMVTA